MSLETMMQRPPRKTGQRRQFGRKLDLKTIIPVVTLCLLALMALFLGRTYNALHSLNNPESGDIYAMITVTPGMTLREVAEFLEDAGVVDQADEFIFAAEFSNHEHRIQVGQYVLPYGESNCELLARLTDAGSAAHLITVPEGYTARRIAGLLQKRIEMDSAAFMQAIVDTALLKKYGIQAASFEGFLFPDSYNFTRRMSPYWVIDLMVRRFFEVFDSSMQDRAEESGFSMLDAVTLASIVQGEMTLSFEAASISALYHNRLKRKMRLQADPTIQYLVKDGPRRLYNGDLAIDSPYNTYRHSGLPPGPVCNPGEEALHAALYPAEESYLYMVSRGDGSHAFNVSFEEHLRDKARLDSIRRTLAREKRKKKASAAEAGG